MARHTETLGSRVLLAREKRLLTQAELARLTGMKQPDISKIERGQIQRTTAIARLAEALRVPAAWLEAGHGDTPDWSDGEPARSVEDYLRATPEPLTPVDISDSMVLQRWQSTGLPLLQWVVDSIGAEPDGRAGQWEEPLSEILDDLRHEQIRIARLESIGWASGRVLARFVLAMLADLPLELQDRPDFRRVRALAHTLLEVAPTPPKKIP